jgi:sugar phosphate isomerase/epimerase
MTHSEQKKPNIPVLLHSYSFRDYPFEVACRHAAQYRYDAIELSPVHYQQDPLPTVAERAGGMAKQCGVPVTAVSFGTDLLQRDDSRWQRNVDHFAQAIGAFAEMGTRLLNASVAPLRNPENDERSGSWLAQDWHYERCAEGLRQLVPVLEEHDALLTLEIHMHTLHDRARSTRDLLRAVGSPRIKATLDPGNILATPGAEPPARAIEMLRDHIGYLHLKNARQVGNHFDFSQLLEEGNLDYYAILTAARQHDLQVPMCIEYCGRGDVRRAARLDIAYLRSLLADIY